MGSFELDKLPVDLLYDRYKKNRLDVQPDYQRSKVWADNSKHELIDTVLKEWPMGLVMLNVDQKLDNDGKPVDYYDVVDGQQRLSCLFEYIDGAEAWTKDTIKKGSKLVPYGSLSEAAQERLKEYRVSVALMKDYEPDEILDVFSRLQNGKPLRIGEKIKALRSPHKSYVRQVADHGLFTMPGSNHTTRDAHWNLAAVFYKGMYNQNPLDRHEYERLSNFLKDDHLFDDKRGHKAVGDTKRILNLLRKITEEAIEQDISFAQKAGNARLVKWTFASLATLEQYYGLTGREHLLAKGLRAYQSAREQEETPEWLAYLVTGRTGRIDTAEVRTCLEHLKNYMVHAASLQPKDSQRYFSAEQREHIYEMSGGYCALCNIELSATNFHADHIVPHGQGGPTALDNGQALCTSCNHQKGGHQQVAP